jgi:cation/acetate symporter
MLAGLGCTAAYIVWFRFLHPELDSAEHWLLGISPEGFGTVGMVVNFAVALSVSALTKPPPVEVQELVDRIRVPRGAGPGHEVAA